MYAKKNLIIEVFTVHRKDIKEIKINENKFNCYVEINWDDGEFEIEIPCRLKDWVIERAGDYGLKEKLYVNKNE